MPTILIIDDSSTQMVYLREVLRTLGMRVLHRNSHAPQSWRALAGHVDLALVALILDKQNGFEIGLQMRDSGFPNVVLYSDSPAATDREWTCAIGLQGLLQVPAPAQKLRRQVVACLGENPQELQDGKRLAS